jgi:hypothetical protein
MSTAFRFWLICSRIVVHRLIRGQCVIDRTNVEKRPRYSRVILFKTIQWFDNWITSHLLIIGGIDYAILGERVLIMRRRNMTCFAELLNNFGVWSSAFPMMRNIILASGRRLTGRDVLLQA